MNDRELTFLFELTQTSCVVVFVWLVCPVVICLEDDTFMTRRTLEKDPRPIIMMTQMKFKKNHAANVGSTSCCTTTDLASERFEH